MNEIKLIIDNRERKIIDTINNEFNKPHLFNITKGIISCECKQLDVGDYLILNGNKILAVIERKSLKDYGASFKDGRHFNKEKLLRLRDETKCKIYYIIEGPLFPDYSTEYAGIPYKKITASITALTINFDIFIIKTQNKDHTARELKLFCERYLNLLCDESSNFYQQMIGNEIRVTGSFEEQVKKADLTPEEKFKKTIVSGWATLKGVSEQSASIIASKYTFLQWINGEIPNDIQEFKVNGRKNSAVINYLTSRPTKELMINILSCCNGFSKKTISEILDIREFSQLFSQYEMFTFGPKNTKFTIKKHENLYKYVTSTI